MDDPGNWRGDQDIVDLESWRRAGLGEFEDEEDEVEGRDEEVVRMGVEGRLQGDDEGQGEKRREEWEDDEASPPQTRSTSPERLGGSGG